MTAPKMVCPAHACPLVRNHTRYGGRWSCPTEGCTVACWESDTSTPADQATRDARHRAHCAFDPLWQQEGAPFHKKRRDAYRWLRERLGTSKEATHIGMFDAATCERVVVEVQTFFSFGGQGTQGR